MTRDELTRPPTFAEAYCAALAVVKPPDFIASQGHWAAWFAHQSDSLREAWLAEHDGEDEDNKPFTRPPLTNGLRPENPPELPKFVTPFTIANTGPHIIRVNPGDDAVVVGKNEWDKLREENDKLKAQLKSALHRELETGSEAFGRGKEIESLTADLATARGLLERAEGYSTGPLTRDIRAFLSPAQPEPPASQKPARCRKCNGNVHLVAMNGGGWVAKCSTHTLPEVHPTPDAALAEWQKANVTPGEKV